MTRTTVGDFDATPLFCRSLVQSFFKIVKFKRFYFQIIHGASKQRPSSSKKVSGDQVLLSAPSYANQLEQIIMQLPSKSVFDMQLLILREEWIKSDTPP